MHKPRFYSLLLAVACSMALAMPASADIVFDFTEASDGGVTVVGTGSGFTTGERATSDWDVSNFDALFLDPANTAEINARFASGVVTNVTTGVSRNIIGFSVDSDGPAAPPSDDLEWTTDSTAGSNPSDTDGIGGPVEFLAGEEFVITINATFNADQLLFSDLALGTFADADPGGSGDEIFGLTTINVNAVPEPTSLAVVAMCLSAGCLRRRR